jgi:hypothetical protein
MSWDYDSADGNYTDSEGECGFCGETIDSSDDFCSLECERGFKHDN